MNTETKKGSGSKSQRHSTKRGLPPGTLVHVGEKKTDMPRITIIDYDSEQCRVQEAKTVTKCAELINTSTTTWINVDGLHEVTLLERFGERFGIHPLVLEDILNTDQRPKAEDYGDYLYIVLKMFHNHTSSERLEAEQISLVVGKNYVLSFQERPGDVFDPVRERIRASKGRIRKMGADYLAYVLLDAIVDSYFMILESVMDRIETIEDELIRDPAPDTLQILYVLKRRVLYLRKSIRPLRELVNVLDRDDSPLIQPDIHVYLRDLYDHVNRVLDTLETAREMLIGMLDIYLSSVSNKMNSVMKVLTVIATMFIPMTFVAGIYGMNFDNMPELHWKYGYPTFWGIIVVILITMVFYFQKKDWL